MHANRVKYDLKEYQNKIRNNAKKLGVVVENISNNTFFVFHPKPNCPWLPETRKKYFSKIRKRAQNIPSNKHYTFCTLTYNANLYTPVEAARRVKKDIDKFFKRLHYRNSKPQYFYVIELTKKKYVHIHLIFDRFVYWAKIKKSWSAVTGSRVIKIKDIKSSNVFYYITKYTTDSQKQSEDLWQFIFKNVDRIYTFSRNFLCKSDNTSKKNTFWFCFFSSKDTDFTADSEQTITDYTEIEVNLLFESCLLRKGDYLLHFNKGLDCIGPQAAAVAPATVAETSPVREFPF